MALEQPAAAANTVNPDELARFAAIAEAWWDPAGKFKPLHKFNPVRISFIRDHLCRHFGRDATQPQPLAGLSLLDIGCGGGLVAEPLTRLGAKVTAIDALEKNIHVARLHAEQMGLEIDYRVAAPEDLTHEGLSFDVVLNMEVVEHVADLTAFFHASASLLKEGGATVYATLNRTAKAWALAVVGAEYVLRWLPRGTHDWKKFLRPSELAAGLRAEGIRLTDLQGMSYNPVRDEWGLSRDLDVNYLAFGVKD